MKKESLVLNLAKVTIVFSSEYHGIHIPNLVRMDALRHHPRLWVVIFFYQLFLLFTIPILLPGYSIEYFQIIQHYYVSF